MKNNKVITLVIVVLLSICSISCSDKTNDQVQSETIQSDTPQQYDAQNKNTYDIKNLDSNLFSILLYVSLGLNLLVICVLIKQYMRQNRQDEDLYYISDDLNKMRNRYDSTPNTGRKVYQERPLSTNDVNGLISKFFRDPKNFGLIRNSVGGFSKLHGYEGKNDTFQTPPVQQLNNADIKTILYAGSAEDATRKFYSVTERVDSEKTIFELHVTNDNHAEYKVTQSAFNIVLTDQSFLEAACDVYKKGSSNLINTENGIAEKQPDGKWLIIEKAKVTIE